MIAVVFMEVFSMHLDEQFSTTIY
jgi:hypothetical protein